MRLLNVHTLRLQNFEQGADRPPYAIASHRWYNDEIDKHDFEAGLKQAGESYKKTEAFCRYVANRRGPGLQPLDWIWIDTCCIDKRSSSELSEAINSMMRWYSNAVICLAFLWDVPSLSRNRTQKSEDTPSIQRDSASVPYNRLRCSVWFRRGWTLQELLAPPIVLFLDQEWNVIGQKNSTGQPRGTYGGTLGPLLNQQIASITGIPTAFLSRYGSALEPTSYADVAVRLDWMKGRTTTRIEDRAYCLLGLCGLFMSMRYGERGQAMQRLHNKIRKNYPVSAEFESTETVASSASRSEVEERSTSSGRRKELRGVPQDARVQQKPSSNAAAMIWARNGLAVLTNRGMAEDEAIKILARRIQDMSPGSPLDVAMFEMRCLLKQCNDIDKQRAAAGLSSRNREHSEDESSDDNLGRISSSDM
ncbi:hypothetical protein TI39_contig530g00002 [Zymoseptoria brevis]|uniref:Heterokaryon incompatibility domain-containing protein n=1 Tax=Zymoseptoria brevis TaxID=1047168 RepID=A0A0F4GIW3_9PEZI|nr:hypothetical protein TI39_contig530g00002 [Zymoseptoria brevis]